jgi:CRP/FNR family transcriptional regulator, cyclic AMP receptor protein
MTKATRTLQHPFLAGMDERHQTTLLYGAKQRQFEPGEILFREGEPANTLYLIESGIVALEAGSSGNVIQTVSGGEVLGWSWLFPPFAWHFQARAIEPVRAICCDGGHILVQAEEDPVFGYVIMRRISQLVIQRLQATRRQRNSEPSTRATPTSQEQRA